MPKGDIIYRNSTYIENVVRHRFVADVASELWRREPGEPLHILQAEVDIAGIDVVLTYKKIFRHIQLKALSKSYTKNPYAVHDSLGGLPGACVIWICYDSGSLQPSTYHMMGRRGNSKMQSLRRFPIAKSPKTKKERLGFRAVKIDDAKFRCLSLGNLVELLFDL